MSNSTALTIAGTAVRHVDGLYSLNDLHRASGGDAGKRPGEFMRNQQTKDLVQEIANAGMSAFEARKGNKGGTYAVRAIAAYYSLPLLDLHERSGFSPLTIPFWATDSLHPTSNSQANVMASMVAGSIESL